jgi:WD40 repeat protein
VWDAVTGEPVREIPSGTIRRTKRVQGHDQKVPEVREVAYSVRISTVAFSADGKWFAAGGSHDGIVQVWDAGSWKEGPVFFHNDSHNDDSDGVSALVFSPDGSMLASTAICSRWYVRGTGKEVSEEERSFDWISAGKDLSELDRRIWTDVRCWELATKKEVGPLSVESGELIGSLAWSPDGRFLAAGGGAGGTVWETSSWKAVRSLDGTIGVAYGSDGTLLAVSEGASGRVVVRDASDWKAIQTFETSRGHVGSPAFSLDGKRIALVRLGEETGKPYWEGEVGVWDVETAGLIWRSQGHIAPVFTVVLDPEATHLFSAAGDGTIKRWEVGSGMEELSVRVNLIGGMQRSALSPDGRLVALGLDGGGVELRSVQGDPERTVLGAHSFSESYDSFRGLAFGPDGQTLASYSLHELKVWGLADRKVRWQVGTRTNLTALAFAAAGKWIAYAVMPGGMTSSDREGKIVVCEVETGTAVRVIPTHLQKMQTPVQGREPSGRSVENYSIASALAFSPDGKVLVAGHNDGTIQAWETDRWQELDRFKDGMMGSGEDPIHGLSFGPDGRLAVATRGGTLYLWKEDGPPKVVYTAVHPVEVLHFSPDGRFLAVGGLRLTGEGMWFSSVLGGGVELLDSETLQGVKIHTGFVHSVNSVSWDSRGGRLLCSDGARAVLRDPADGDEAVEISAARKEDLGESSFRRCMVMHPEGKFLATEGGDEVIFLDPGTLRELKRFRTGGGDLKSLALFPSASGSLMATGGAEGRVELWDADRGERVRTLLGHTHRVPALGFTPDGKVLASGSRDRTVRLWDVETGHEIRRLDHADATEVRAVAFDPTGTVLATAGLDYSVKLWEVGTGKQLRILFGHDGMVDVLAFSPDGKVLASGAIGERTIRLWDPGTGRQLRSIQEAWIAYVNGGVRSLAFDREGKRLFAACPDHQVRSWSVSE